MYENDTIAAISTAHGTGGIGVIRVSGSKTFTIAARIFSGKKPFEQLSSHTINYGKIIEPGTNEIIDEVLISKMKSPNTFTREDIVEINCHGGIMVLKRILELIVDEGARLAEPGEFTKRAFLNGRIDLSQAEAVIDLINSKTSESSRAAIDQLEGKLSGKLKESRSSLIELLAHIEVTLDYPEHDIEEITGEKVYKDALEIVKKLQGIIKGFDKGRVIREGINVTIIGKPNVGKSTLLNELSGKNSAIVTDIPGTTRDIIEEYINLGGIPLRIIDTAGIRDTNDVVEKIGVQKAENAAASADLVVMMIDAATGIKNDDLEILAKIKNKKILIFINKADLADNDKIKTIEESLRGEKVIVASLKEGSGLEILEKEITELFFTGEINTNSEILVTNIRHKILIDKAIESLSEARAAYENAMPLDCIAIDIKNAAEYLGQITGESVSEDVMHEIFSRFCLGK